MWICTRCFMLGSISCPWCSSCLLRTSPCVALRMWSSLCCRTQKLTKPLINPTSGGLASTKHPYVQKCEQHTLWYKSPSTLQSLSLLQKTLACLWVSCRLFQQFLLDVALFFKVYSFFYRRAGPLREGREQYFQAFVCVWGGGEYFFSPPKTICSLNPSVKKVTLDRKKTNRPSAHLAHIPAKTQASGG